MAHFVPESIPHRSCGIGNILAVISLVALFVFIFSNLWFDYKRFPTIVDVTAKPVIANPGEAVELSALADGFSNGNYKWLWKIKSASDGSSFNKKLDSNRKTAYWLVDKSVEKGDYQVVIQIIVGGESVDQANLRLTVRK